MVICELCGSANVELDEYCRVCGQALKQEQAAQATVPAQTSASMAHDAQQLAAPVPAAAQSTWPTQSVPVPAPPTPVTEPVERSLQMSAFSTPVESTAPPMLGGTAEIEQAPVENTPGSDVPSFMQTGNRITAPGPDPVQLISANDLPEWLKQIADQDAAKAEADAAATTHQSDAPATIVKKALPGETMVANSTTNWLSKSGQEADSPDHWDSSEIANANWGNADAAPHAQAAQEYPSIIPPTAFVPSSTDAYSSTKPKKKRSFGSKPTSMPSDKPFYRNQTVQLFVIVILVAFMAMLFLT